MKHDEHEMLIEYSEMSILNMNAKEYENLKKDYLFSKNAIDGFKKLVGCFVNKTKVAKA